LAVVAEADLVARVEVLLEAEEEVAVLHIMDQFLLYRELHIQLL
jgi:hypothetical protein